MTADVKNHPRLVARIAAAIVIGIASGMMVVARDLQFPWHRSDFGVTWFGAGALLHGANPYALIGPGLQFDWQWRMMYPVTAMVTAIPLSFVPETVAAFLFVAISGGLLAYAITRDGWYRLPLFLSWPYAVAVGHGQWSPLFSAIWCLPSLGWLLAAKPSIGLAIFAATSSRRLMVSALIGCLILAAIGFILLPSWPLDWLASLRTQIRVDAPILRLGGVVVLLALLRWRRPEARLLLALACVPQTIDWYETVPLMLIPNTFRESLVYSVILSLGFILPPYIIPVGPEEQMDARAGVLIIAIAYLPALIMILRRPNEGAPPAWMWWTTRREVSPRSAA
jgi:hypothetical protein